MQTKAGGLTVSFDVHLFNVVATLDGGITTYLHGRRHQTDLVNAAARKHVLYPPGDPARDLQAGQHRHGAFRHAAR